jgi:exopolysaccharide production protein ExoQ
MTLKRNTRMLLYPGIVGVFLSFRECLTFLWFQSNAQLGSSVTIAAGLILMVTTIFYSVGSVAHEHQTAWKAKPVYWIFIYLALALVSLTWTGAESTTAAAAYWLGLFTDVATIVILIKHDTENELAIAVIKGFVIGASAVALIAWCIPVTEDFRLGNEDFLHPNGLGHEFAIATLFAQYLAEKKPSWKWVAFPLGVTLLRTLSKTSIIAFIVAEVFYLARNTQMSKRIKIQISVAGLSIVACFAGVLRSYVETYADTGNQAETLTGRTIIWATSGSLAIEKPWLGYGFHAYHTVVPLFGTFHAWHAHNELLQQFFSYGVVGVIVAARLYWVFYRQVLRASDSGLRSLALALLVFAIVRGLTDTEQFDLSYPLWLLALMSLSVAHISVSKSAQAQ